MKVLQEDEGITQNYAYVNGVFIDFALKTASNVNAASSKQCLSPTAFYDEFKKDLDKAQ